MNIRALLYAGCACALLTTGACSRDPAPSTLADTGGTSAAQTQESAEAKSLVVANAGSVIPRYAATLAEGMDFSRPGAPEFVTEITGLSGPESWGRWTDANLGPTKLRLRSPLPQHFTLRIKARDYFGLNAQQKLTVRVGNQEKGFILLGSEDQSANLVFDGVSNVDSIEISVPKTSSPSANDSRRVGVGLISFSIHE
ncbi:hypothetical protein AB4Y64_12795 [Lysobacter sp. TAF61]|uniref:DUF7024 domain-containing protein n=1 Tax=Lysobacter sp. TAF61 TaxID=3233072 RepID=UPI003F95198C